MNHQELLKLAGVVEPPVPVERIARLRGAEVRYVPYQGKMSGLLYQSGKNIIIGVNALDAKTRQRFTIAHEIGHLELHALPLENNGVLNNGLHIDRGFPFSEASAFYAERGELSSQGTDAQETQANAFAARLLMPATMLQHDLHGCLVDWEDDEFIRSLASRYKVSLQAMIIRLTTLRLMVRPSEDAFENNL